LARCGCLSSASALRCSCHCPFHLCMILHALPRRRVCCEQTPVGRPQIDVQPPGCAGRRPRRVETAHGTGNRTTLAGTAPRAAGTWSAWPPVASGAGASPASRPPVGRGKTSRQESQRCRARCRHRPAEQSIHIRSPHSGRQRPSFRARCPRPNRQWYGPTASPAWPERSYRYVSPRCYIPSFFGNHFKTCYPKMMNYTITN
jgi:hypothetical protein